MPLPLNNSFEKFAFECALREHPGDRNAALAFTDWLCDHGYTLRGAKCHVTRTIREAIEQRQITWIQDQWTTSYMFRAAVHAIFRRAITRQHSDFDELKVSNDYSPPVRAMVIPSKTGALEIVTPTVSGQGSTTQLGQPVGFKYRWYVGLNWLRPRLPKEWKPPIAQ